MTSCWREQGVDPRVTDLATAIKAAQGPEITEMQGWLGQWGNPPMPPMESGEGHSGHDMGGMSGDAMGLMSDEEMTALKNARRRRGEQALPDGHDRPPRGRNRHGAERDQGRQVRARGRHGTRDRQDPAGGDRHHERPADDALGLARGADERNVRAESGAETRRGVTFVAVRILVQRVTSASVTVDGEIVGAITPDGQGLLALVGVTHDDDASKAQRLAEKLWQLRILDDEKSAADVGAPILVVSQFTLYANTAKGRRPTWNAAAPGAVAEPLVTVFADALRRLGAHVETGVFGADMKVELVNDGPVTVQLEL